MTTSAKSAAVNRATDEVGSLDPRDVFMRDPDQPSRPERQFVHDRDRDYTLDGSESRTLSTVGAFRVVSERDLRDPRENVFDLRHLEEQGLVHRVLSRERACLGKSSAPTHDLIPNDQRAVPLAIDIAQHGGARRPDVRGVAQLGSAPVWHGMQVVAGSNPVAPIQVRNGLLALPSAV